jgi:chromosome partition protein MukB
MSRARATALVLVNWKGVFFERYLLDRHVTALEGANGAGKTTVMIAAYVVLLPDLSRLKFVNVGETGATGGDRGIWGRLGEIGPSYAALEITLGDGERVLMGVYLERKAAPALSLTPFVVTGLPAELSPERFLLCEVGENEQVATLRDLQTSVPAVGGALEVFPSAKDYFASLFERGISPLRLSTDEERNKFNDMLRTSMTGGISRTLTSDLRSFLFKQQTALFDTLSRMRKNLESCRRTRVEVTEARVLEHEINGIYAAGYAMISAALAASKEQARESRLALERAEQIYQKELAEREEQRTRRSVSLLRKQSLLPRVERAREAESAAQKRLIAVKRAMAASERLSALAAENLRVLPEVELAVAGKAEAQARREHEKLARDQAQETLLRAATGLASLQAGLEELHRQAHAFRQVREKLVTARDALTAFLASPKREATLLGAYEPALFELNQALAASSLEGLGISEAIRQLNQARQRLDRERAERDRRADVAERRRKDHLEARAALGLLCGAPVETELAARARQELARQNELELLAARAAELTVEHQRLSDRADRQRAVKGELRALGLDPLPSARDFVIGLTERETVYRDVLERQRQHEASAKQQAEREASARSEQETLLARRESYGRLAGVIAHLAASGQAAPRSRADLNAALRANDDTRQILRSRIAELTVERQAALASALECETEGGGPHGDLVRIAERVDGQLLAARYEDLDVDAARRAEAELGPLASAIVVDDPRRALAQVLTESHEQRDIWLLQAGSAWPLTPLDAASARLLPEAKEEGAEPEALGPPDGPPPQVVVDLGYGLRITRLPASVTLGRAARQRRAEQLRAEAEAMTRNISDLEARKREQESAARELETLQEHWELWAAGDPESDIERVCDAIARAQLAQAEEQRLARELRIEAARLDVELRALKAQLGDHHLLDPPDYEALEGTARELSARAKGAAAELERCKAARRTLIALVHDLADAPPDGAELEAWRLEQPELDAQRDRLFAVAEALGVVESQSAALGWADAERALLARTELVPELESQHERARAELGRAQIAFEAAEAEWESATATAQEATARRSAIDAHLSRAREELRAEGVEDASAEALASAEREVEEKAALVDTLRAEEGSIDADAALAEERLGEAEKRTLRAESELAAERARAEPAERNWRDLSRAALEAGVELDAEAGGSPAPSAQRWLEARSKRELLGDRLEAARGGVELARTIHEAPASDYLTPWLAVRSWLLRRLPAPIAELGDPLLGLSRLRTDLHELEGRLERQEGDLRGTSGDVARSIDVQLRRAVAQLKRLNRSLEGVSFGSIHSMRVQMERIDKMDQVLSALREGETQELLFQSNLPIEEALDEIFRRHGGGRTGGQRLVDYREYLELFVQIQRRPDSGWERVNPSQVSTGEAIGIGAALMMVILAEWERDDHLLRGERRLGSLRFLFLDEANRLSQDNLGVLFDLCQTLDLQLLIAAPEVARAEGNTTYHLVRRVSEDGREEVLVTGRRAAPPAEVATSDATTRLPAVPPPTAPEQLGLL